MVATGIKIKLTHRLYKGKPWFKLNIMGKLKFQLDRKSLETIYISLIRPLLEYSNGVWDNCTQYKSTELEKSKMKLPISLRELLS